MLFTERMDLQVHNRFLERVLIVSTRVFRRMQGRRSTARLIAVL